MILFTFDTTQEDMEVHAPFFEATGPVESRLRLGREAELKLPAASYRESSKCKELYHFIVVRSLTPSASGGLRGMRSLEHFQFLAKSRENGREAKV